MRRRAVVVLGALLLGIAVVATPTLGIAASSSDETVLRFDTMVGVTGPFLGPSNPIRGVDGGGQPWKIADAEGRLRADGRLEIQVRGLVLVSTGANPASAFRGLVSCQSFNGSTPTVVNVSTGDFPATSTGDSKIEAELTLPQPCIAPIVFVTNSAGRWFAATGV